MSSAFYETDSASSCSRNSKSSNSKKLTRKLRKFSSFISKKIKNKLNTHSTNAKETYDNDQERHQPMNHFKKRHSSYIATSPVPTSEPPRSYFSTIDLEKSAYPIDKVESMKEQYFDKKQKVQSLNMVMSASLSPPPRSQINKSKSSLIPGCSLSSNSGSGVDNEEGNAAAQKPGLCRSNTLGTYYQYYHQYHRLSAFSNASLYDSITGSNSNSKNNHDGCHSSYTTSTTTLTKGSATTEI